MTKAINFEFEDENTGAIAAYHVIEYMGLDYRNGVVSVTVNGYVSQKAFEKKRHYLCSHSASFDVENFEGVTRDWVYEKLVASGSGYAFEGADLV